MRSKWWTLGVVLVATFMLLLDVTVVNVALPEIQRDLDASFTDLQWVVDSYALALAATILICGSLGDRFGHRRMFIGGLGVFVVASLASGLAPDPLVLNVFRASQGLGGAAMLATSLALIANAYEGRDRKLALGAWGAATGASVAIGPLVGGAVIDTLGWEWIFFVNVPIGLAALAITATRVGEYRDPNASGRPDIAGLLTLSGALVALTLALFEGNDNGWGSPLILGLFGGGAALLAAFVAIEARHPNPLLELSIWRKPTTAGASIAIYAVAAAAFALLLYLVLYVQNVLGYGPLTTGLILLPLTVPSFLVAAVSGRVAGTVSVRLLVAVGLAVTGTGALLMRLVEPGSDWPTLLAGSIVMGVGIGLVNPSVAAAAIGTVEPAKSGKASGLNSTFRLVGVASGIAGLGALFEHSISDSLESALPQAPAQAVDAVAAGRLDQLAAQAPAGVRDTVLQAADVAFLSGLDAIFLASAVIAFVGAALAAVLIRATDFVEPGNELPSADGSIPAGHAA
ncbi:MAG: MFS transporter [Solirubrobacterales bacterium]